MGSLSTLKYKVGVSAGRLREFACWLAHHLLPILTNSVSRDLGSGGHICSHRGEMMLYVLEQHKHCGHSVHLRLNK
jgi:hypothetical protein